MINIGRKKKGQKTVTARNGKRYKVYTNKNRALSAKDRAPRTQRIHTHKDKFGKYYTVRTVR